MRKILVGIDLSCESQLAAAHALDLARRRDATIVLAMVAALPDAAALVPDTWYGEAIRKRFARERQELGKIQERLTRGGPEVSQVVVDGFVDEVLPAVASRTGADLLVVGTHGRTGFRRAFLGSVAERMVRVAPCSVLVARGPAPIGGYARIVVGTDFSSSARRALRLATSVAARTARVDIVHCWQAYDGLPTEIPFGGPPDGGELAIGAAIAARGAELVAAAREDSDLDVRFRQVAVAPPHGLVEHAAAIQADLLVVGTHGRRGLSRLLLGSVAEGTVRHAGCATLVARE